jgi:hypothetical protein
MSNYYDSTRKDSVLDDTPTATTDMSDDGKCDTPQSDAAIEVFASEDDQQPMRPPTRINASSFAAPTKASAAKKNEKIELAQYVRMSPSIKEPYSRPGSAIRQYSGSRLGTRPSSRQWGGFGRSRSARYGDDGDTFERPLSSMGLQETSPGREQSGNAKPGLSDSEVKEEGFEEEQDETSPVWVSNEPEKVAGYEEAQREEDGSDEEGREELPVLEEKKGEDEPSQQDITDVHVQEKVVHAEQEPLMQKEEPLEHSVQEIGTELEVPQQQSSPPTQDINASISQEDESENLETQAATSGDHIRDTSRSSSKEENVGIAAIISTDTKIVPAEIIAEIEELKIGLQKAEEQRDEAMRQREAVQQELQTIKEDTEKLKQEHEKLSIQLRESEAKIAARNAREPGLPPLEAVEAENKRLRLAVEKTRLDLDTKKKEAIEATSCCEQLDDQLREAMNKLKEHEVSIQGLCEVISMVTQNTSTVAACDDEKLDELFQSLAQDADIGKLRGEFVKLIKTFHGDIRESQEKIRELESQVAEEQFEYTRLETAMDIQQKDLLSPFIQSTYSTEETQMDGNGFKQYYYQEREKRIDLEWEVHQANQSLSHLLPENERLHSELIKAQEELAELRPRAAELETEAKGWMEDFKEKESQLEQRTEAFEATVTEQQLETFRYIKAYYEKVKDQAHWEVQGLQKKLAASEQEGDKLTWELDRSKLINMRLEDTLDRLKKSNNARDIHIRKVEQAFMLQGPWPIMSPSTTGSRTPSSSTSSSNPASLISSCTHPLEVNHTRPPIPRCHLPAAIQARDAKLALHRQKLDEAREAEIFMLNVKPGLSAAKTPHSDIMEQVRKWNMKELYPPANLGWAGVAWQSAWRRWDGAVWAREFAKGKDVDFLKKMGVWHQEWV